MTILFSITAVLVQQASVQVAEIASTKGEAASPFATISSLIEARPGQVVVSDDVASTLYVWHVSGDSVVVLARRGRGPGEVLTPTSMAQRPRGGFAVYDISNGILLFDRGMKFDRQVVLKGGFVSNPKGLAVLGDGSFIIAGGRLRDPRHLHRYDSSGTWVEGYGEPPAGLESIYSRIQTAGGALRSLPQGLLVSFGTPLRIVQFGNDGFRSVRAIAEDVALLPELTEAAVQGPPEPELQGARQFLWWHDRSTGVYALSDGRILNVVTRFYKGDSVWDVYTSDGRRVARSIIPRAYDPADMTADGHILASYRDPDTDERVATLLRVTIR